MEYKRRSIEKPYMKTKPKDSYASADKWKWLSMMDVYNTGEKNCKIAPISYPDSLCPHSVLLLLSANGIIASWLNGSI